jgi:hypothetical protein
MILVKTEAGHQVLKDRSVRLTVRQRSAFILFDGRRSVEEVIGAVVGIAPEDIDQLVLLGLLAHVDPEASPAMMEVPPVAGGREVVAQASVPAVSAATPPSDAQPAGDGRSGQQRYKDAYPIATQLTGSLGLRGFRLNLAVEGSSTCEQLLDLLPKIRSAVGPDKAAALERALGV